MNCKMKSLSQYICESSQNSKYEDICKHCANIQGQSNDNDARDCIKAMQSFFNDSYYDKVDLNQFKSDHEEGYYYLIYDGDNYLMCVWENNKFRACTVERKDKKPIVKGNLLWTIKDVFNFIDKMDSKYTILECD